MIRLTRYLCAMILFLSLFSPPLRAQEATPSQSAAASSPSDPLQSAAQALFKGFADGDLAVVAQNTSMKYARRLKQGELRPTATGPKLTASFDGTVTVVRKSADDAVVEAKIFTPESTENPTAELSRVRIYMVREGGDWKAAAADKKQAASDADINGGWYHAAFFTFCPNKGLMFVPNHFSRELECRAVAQCRF
jgi:hypothetical protein